MINFNYYSPTKIYFGKEEENNVGTILKERGATKVLLVYGKSAIKKMGLYDKVVTSLNNANVSFLELAGVEANPKIELARLGRKLALENKVDYILAVGGGSAIDTAKNIAAAYYIEEDSWCLNDHTVTPKKALPLGVILTISAAGSELSNSCVMTNPDINKKNGFNSDLVRPAFAILNPELTYTVSPYQTACGIVDIMMHTLERFLVPSKDTYLTDNFALGLLKATKEAGDLVMKDPYNYEGRANLMLASSFSHNGLTGMGLKFYFTVHKLEHEVSGMYDYVAHGAGLSVLFPAWAKAVCKEMPERFAILGKEVFNLDIDLNYEGALKSIECFKEYFKSLNMPVTMNELDIKEDAFKKMAMRLTSNDIQKVPGFVPLDAKLVEEIFNLAK